MKLLEAMTKHDYEQVIALNNNASGLRGFIVIHDTTLGPALGGTRIWRYQDEVEALEDGLRLARAMTYKAALAGLDAGGGKAVIVEHPGLRRELAMRTFGRFVESLHGRFQTGTDVGLTPDDVGILRQETHYVGCEGVESDDCTALGVMQGIRASLDHLGGKDSSLAGVTVAIQGLGSIGYKLAAMLSNAGSQLIVTDLDESKARKAQAEFGAKIVAPEEIYSVEADVFSPCALGGIVNDRTLPQIKARIIAGAANNVLADDSQGWKLRDRGIVYAPDYLINAGALIHGANLRLKSKKDNEQDVLKIYDRTCEVLALADREKSPTSVIADRLAESRLKAGKGFQDLYWASAKSGPEPERKGCCS
jgi:leucine dehydrogenase